MRSTTNLLDNWSWYVDVHSSHSVIACLASQYAGWNLSNGDFNALGSGPGRAMGSKEPLFEELNYRDKTDTACLVIESNIMPPIEVAENIAEQCDISPQQVDIDHDTNFQSEWLCADCVTSFGDCPA